MDRPEPAAADPGRDRRLARAVRRLRAAEAVDFTSFHQSPLPTALVLRMAGVRRISAISEDYPGSLLDVRHQLTADIPEARRNLSLAQAAGFRLPPGDPGTLAIRGPLPDARPLAGDERYVVVHPGASVPARHPSADRTAAMIGALAAAGHRVVVTGSAAERALAGPGPGRPGRVVNLCGRTSLPMLASVLAHADVVVAPNTGAAHLAAAVGTPVVSLFAPVVPAARWAPYGVPTILLGRPGCAVRGQPGPVLPGPRAPVPGPARALRGSGRRRRPGPPGGRPRRTRPRPLR